MEIITRLGSGVGFIQHWTVKWKCERPFQMTDSKAA